MEKNFEKRNWGQADFFKKDDVDHMNSPYDVSSLLHYGPQEFSKNGENVLSYIHGLPDLSWPEPAPEDPLSVIDEVKQNLPRPSSSVAGGARDGLRVSAASGENTPIHPLQPPP